jgi:hypothetical protein
MDNHGNDSISDVSCEGARAVYSNRSSAAYPVYREDQWQRRSKHTETES